MRAVDELLNLVREERDAVLPFFDAYAQLGSAYEAVERMAAGEEFQAMWEALHGPPGAPDLRVKLDELAAARARVLHLVLAFAAERKEGKWPEMLKPESQDAIRRLNEALEGCE